jgi:hypothetical protein
MLAVRDLEFQAQLSAEERQQLNQWTALHAIFRRHRQQDGHGPRARRPGGTLTGIRLTSATPPTITTILTHRRARA